MSRIALVLLLVGVALAAFGWWGTKTDAGRRRFDEMAGIIPELSWWAGCGIGAIGIIWVVVSVLRALVTKNTSVVKASSDDPVTPVALYDEDDAEGADA